MSIREVPNLAALYEAMSADLVAIYRRLPATLNADQVAAELGWGPKAVRDGWRNGTLPYLEGGGRLAMSRWQLMELLVLARSPRLAKPSDAVKPRADAPTPLLRLVDGAKQPPEAPRRFRRVKRSA